MALRPRSYSGDLITSIVSREAPFERNVRARTNPVNNMYRVPTYAKTKSSYGRKKPISQSKAVATAKRHNFKVNVERVLDRRVEVKRAYQSQGVNVSAYNQGPNMNVNSMIPYINITQGTGQSNRIGNQIRTRKCTLTVVLSPWPYNGTSNFIPIPQDVVMMFGVVKNSKAIVPTNADFQKLFQEGNSFSAPSSNLTDVTRDVNTDWFTIRKQFRCKVGTAYAGGTGNNANGQYYANNDYRFNVIRKLDLTSICPKLVRFNDSVNTQPTNDGLYMWVYCVPADGSTANQIAPIRLDYTINYSFEDA